MEKISDNEHTHRAERITIERLSVEYEIIDEASIDDTIELCMLEKQAFEPCEFGYYLERKIYPYKEGEASKKEYYRLTREEFYEHKYRLCKLYVKGIDKNKKGR